MRILVIGCSLNVESNSQILARSAVDELIKLGIDSHLLDLREHPLQLCGGPADPEDIAHVRAAIAEAEAILLAVPIYNFDTNAASKNLIEHTGSVWEGKIVGFLCTAGGRGSYMAITGLTNSLMLDFRCLIVPRFVFTTADAFADGKLVSAEIHARVMRLCQDIVRLTKALVEHGKS